MLLYLMRHGTAEPSASSDRERQLSSFGRKQVAQVAENLVTMEISPGCLVHSPLRRAYETAAILGEHFPHLELVELEEVVAAGDDLYAALHRHGLVDPFVVGHAPGLPVMATKLLATGGRLDFHCATVAGFEVDAFPPTQPGLLVYFAATPIRRIDLTETT